jgi:hypothetical protein
VQGVDIQKLGEKEQKAFALSFRSALSQRGMRNLVVSTLVALTAVVVFSIYGIEQVPLAAMALFIVVVLIFEKVSYFREIRVYKSLVRSLALRIEQLQATGPDLSEEPPSVGSGRSGAR